MDGFNEALLEAVDEGLLALGHSVRAAIYRHLKEKYAIERSEIPSKVEDFHEALEAIFGAGAGVLERVTAKRLYARLGLNFEPREGWSLIDYVKEAKKRVEGARWRRTRF
ncbi:TPA: hypothetical protein EYP26_01535 [Candidatus Bathyarchaeota archaeon]|nr:hypothetical protein [Candidatus Bathyarchaeota archaeon]